MYNECLFATNGRSQSPKQLSVYYFRIQDIKSQKVRDGDSVGQKPVDPKKSLRGILNSMPFFSFTEWAKIREVITKFKCKLVTSEKNSRRKLN